MRLRRKFFYSFLLPACAIVAFLFNTGVAQAAPFARGAWYGYFNGNNYDQWGDNLFPGGIGVTDIDSFVNFYKNALNDGNARDQASAAFTIMTMLGEPAGSPMGDAYSQFPTWETTVRWYAANNLIGWADNYSYNFNTYLQKNYNDVAWYSDSNTLPSIVFYNPGGGSYAIKRDCANPVGDMVPLQIIPPTTVSCGTITNVYPNRPEVGDTMNVTATVNFSGGPPNPSPSNWSMSVSGVGNVGVSAIWQGGNTYYLKSGNFSVPSTARYSVSWAMQVNSVWTSPNPCGGTFSNSDSFDVFNYPYIDVEGGDTAAGARFATGAGQPCAASNTSAGIVNWNKDGNPTYSGGGGQYGASAFNWIQDFLSNKGNPNGGSYGSLSFAGVNVNQPAGQFGGFFGKGPCVDYWSKAPTSGQSFSTPSNQSLNGLSGIYVRNGDLTINPSNIGAGTHLTVYVNGNVNIRGNGIKYGGNPNPTWTSLSDIPSFKLIVHGSIFIDASVDQLDGTYVAVPDPGYQTAHNRINAPLAGTISTCSSGFSALSPAVNPGNIGTCRRTLTVNGSFAANTVYFLRTIGSMSNGTPAEQFNYNPEVWLSPDSQGTIDPAYQSIVGLPPVL